MTAPTKMGEALTSTDAPTVIALEDAPLGRCIPGSLITCKDCGEQRFLTSGFDRGAHRWWEDIGWGKINPHMRGKNGKGDLYCGNCFPAAHKEAVGE